MSLRSTKSNIRSKINSGAFEDNSVDWSGLMSGAKIVAQGMLDKAEREREEKKEERKRKAAAAAKIAAEQKKKEEKERELKRKATAIAARYNATSNPTAINYITEQLFTFGDSAAALIESDIKSGRVTFVDEMRDRPLQGPDVPRDFPLTVDPDGEKPVTEFGNTKEALNAGNVGNFKSIPDAEGNETNPYKTEGDQMAEIFAPVSEEPAVSLPYQGVEINPDANNVDIDWGKVTNETQVKYYRRMHDSGKQVLSEEDLAVLVSFEEDFDQARAEALKKENRDLAREMTGYSNDQLIAIVNTRDGNVYSPSERSTANRILKARQKQEELDNTPDPVDIVTDLAKMDATDRADMIKGLNPLVAKGNEKAALIVEAAGFMSAEEPEDLSKYFSNINTVAGVESKILAVKNSKLTAADQKKVIDQLEDHKKTLQDLNADLDLTDQTYYGSVMVDNVATQAEFIMNKDGKLYSPSLMKTFEKDKVTNLISTENADKLRQDATTLQDDVFNPMIEQRTGVLNLLMQGVEIDQLVEGADGKVLTFMGGRLPSILKRIQSEYNAFDSFLRGGNQEQIEALATDYTADELRTLEDIGISADEFSRFQAMAIEFAFTYARTGMGQQRTTDQDFQAAYKVVTAGSTYATYTKNLRDLITKGLNRATNEHDQYLKYPTLGAAMLKPNADKVFGPFMQTLDEYLAAQGEEVAAQIEWSKTEYVAPDTSDDPSVKTPPKTPEAVLQQTLDKYQNDPAFAKDRIAVSQMSESDKATYIGILAKQKNIPVNILTDLLTRD